MPRADILHRAAAAVVPGAVLLAVGPGVVLTDLALPADGWRTQQARTTTREVTGQHSRTGVLADSAVPRTA